VLADDLISAVGTADDRLFLGAFGRLAPLLRQAQRFDLAPEVIHSAHAVTASPIKSQLAALSLSRLPFTTTWFEWPGMLLGYPPGYASRPDLYVAKRVGALIRVDASLQRGDMIFAHATPDRRHVVVMPLMILFDFRETPGPLPNPLGMRSLHDVLTAEELAAYIAKRPASKTDTLADLRALSLRFGFAPNPLTKEYIATRMVAKDYQDVVNDIQVLPWLLRAVIMLLNSRNLTAAETRPIAPRLNHARAKSGKTPLLDYTHIRISLSHALAARAGEAADSRNPTRLHLVRGHFKVRRTGIYWWSPFTRGNPAFGSVQQTRHVSN
jgi:hypothetical protein